MWSTRSDRTQAERNTERARQEAAHKAAHAERVKLPLDERARLHLNEDSNEEVEEVYALLDDVSVQSRRTRDAVRKLAALARDGETLGFNERADRSLGDTTRGEALADRLEKLAKSLDNPGS
jgi:DNA repair ATPase RecN